MLVVDNGSTDGTAALAASAGVELVWGTNPAPAQAEVLVKYAATSFAASPVAEWEFGNEPDPSSGSSGGVQLAKDFAAFDRMLNASFPPTQPGAAKRYRLVGPDLGFGPGALPPTQNSNVSAFLQAFLGGAAHLLDASTVHIYPFDHNDVGGDTGWGGKGDPVCAGEPEPVGGWCNYTRALWSGPGELPDTRPVQDFALPFAAASRSAGVKVRQ